MLEGGGDRERYEIPAPGERETQRKGCEGKVESEELSWKIPDSQASV